MSDEPKENKLVEVRGSGIHQSGLFAKRRIKKGVKVIEYVGDRVIKAESERRSERQFEIGEKTGDGSVYMFTVNDRYDIDGAVEGNIARFANHSCDPNCETDVIDDRVWIISLREIKKGEELVYNYNFDLESYESHPCLCGSRNCVGYITGDQYWPKLRKLIKKKRAKQKAKRKGNGKPG